MRFKKKLLLIFLFIIFLPLILLDNPSQIEKESFNSTSSIGIIKSSNNDLPITNYTIHNEIESGEIKEFNVSTIPSVTIKIAFIIFKDIYENQNNFTLIQKGSFNIFSLNISYSNFTFGFYKVYYGLIDNLNNINSTKTFTIEFISNLPYPFILTTTANSPDTNGIFKLKWNSSKNANNYSIYRSNQFINEIEGNEIIIRANIKTLYYDFSDYSNGVYYFITLAFNDFGNYSSNCMLIWIELEVETIDLDDPIEKDPYRWIWILILILGIILIGIVGIYISRKLWNRYAKKRFKREYSQKYDSKISFQ